MAETVWRVMMSNWRMGAIHQVENLYYTDFWTFADSIRAMVSMYHHQELEEEELERITQGVEYVRDN